MREATRRRFILVLLAAGGLGFIWLLGWITRPASVGGPRVGGIPTPVGRAGAMPDRQFDRVLFVCRNEAGHYGPGVYLHGSAGGGPACLEFVREAAPFMRRPEVGNAAAGLCGYLFKVLGDDVAALGGLSLHDEPRPGPDNVVDWQAYCGRNVDLILIDVDRGTAECYSTTTDDEASAKTWLGRIAGLRFGPP